VFAGPDESRKRCREGSRAVVDFQSEKAAACNVSIDCQGQISFV